MKKKSLSPFRGCWGQEVIFQVAEAKFWVSSSFYKFSFRIFVVLDFEVVWPRRPQRPRKGVREFFQKLHFWNQCIPAKKLSYVPASRLKFFTKSLHRGGVIMQWWLRDGQTNHFHLVFVNLICNVKVTKHRWKWKGPGPNELLS